MKKLTIMSLVASAMLAGFAGEAKAETDPRDYSAIMAVPTKTSLVLGYYRHISSADSASSSTDLALFRYAYCLKWGNFLLVPLDFILPVGDITAHVESPATPGISQTTVHGSGIGDLIIVPTAVYEVPEGESASTFVGASWYVFAPTGNYNPDRPINLGNNRWAFKEEIYAGQKFAKRHTFEVLGNIQSFTANPDNKVAGETHSLQQKSTLGFEAHYMVDVAPYFGVGASYYAYANGRANIFGGDTGLPDTTVAPQQTIQSVRGTFAIRVEKQSLLYLSYNQDIAASGGGSISRFVGARLSHFF